MTAMSHIQRTLAAFSAGLASLLACTAAHAQCPPEGWLPGEGYCGASGNVEAMTLWDPDGDGPQHAKVIVGGQFRTICNINAKNVAMYDPDTNSWAPMGSGIGDESDEDYVLDFATLPNGRLIAVGRFGSTSGMSAGSVARWTGTEWIPVGSGALLNGNEAEVKSIVALPNGDFVIGGFFNTAGGAAAVGVAKWDGEAWSGLGGGVAGATYTMVTDMDLLPNGDLVAGGDFLTAGGVAAQRIARWNGTAWAAVGPGRAAKVMTVKALQDGSIVASGLNLGTTALWDGNTWTDMGFESIDTFTIASNGDLLAGRPGAIFRWTGTDWEIIALSNGWVTAIIELEDGDLMAGGHFTTIGDSGARFIARRRETTWSPLCNGFNDGVYDLKSLPNGDIIAAGKFTHAGGTTAKRIARWDGANWHPVGAGVDDRDAWINSVAVMPNGNIAISGYFYSLGGVSAIFLAQWDGQSWASIGGALGGGDLAVLPNNGHLVSTRVSVPSPEGHIDGIARWDGQTWHGLPSNFGPTGQGAQWSMDSIATLRNGDVLVGGGFGIAPNGVAVNGIARWNGSTWLPLGSGLGINGYGPGSVRAILPLPDGSIVAGGRFGVSSGGVNCWGVAKWNGSAWLPMGNGVSGGSQSEGVVHALARLPNGDIVATGDFVIPGTPECRGIARWNGSVWLPMDTGIGNRRYFDDGYALCLDRNGDLLIGGEFEAAGPHFSVNLARYAAPITRCAADLDDGSATGVRDCAVTIDDLLFFLTAFEAGDLAVDLDNGTFTGVHDGAVTIDDLLYFLVHFEEGC